MPITIKVFREINEAIETNFPNDLPGINQVLILCEQIIKGSLERPVLFIILREFFNRINYKNLPIEDMYDEIMESLGTSTYDELLNTFEEPYLIDFYVQLVKFGDYYYIILRRNDICD